MDQYLDVIPFNYLSWLRFLSRINLFNFEQKLYKSSHYLFMADQDCESEQCLTQCNRTGHPGVLFLLWGDPICWNEKVRSPLWVQSPMIDLWWLGMLFGLIYCLLVFSESERSQSAYVTFNDAQGAETAVLLSVSFSILFLCLLLGLHPNVWDIHDMKLYKTFFCSSVRPGSGVLFIFGKMRCVCHILSNPYHLVCNCSQIQTLD